MSYLQEWRSLGEKANEIGATLRKATSRFATAVGSATTGSRRVRPREGIEPSASGETPVSDGTAPADPRPEARSDQTSALRRWLGDSVSRTAVVCLALLLLVLAGLPVAVWFDLRALSERALREQADSFVSVIDGMRAYYASNIVARVAAAQRTEVLSNYAQVPGAIPIPATLSLEIADIIREGKGNIRFRFFSDLPFKNRASHAFDDFERQALAALRANPNERVSEITGSIFNRQIRLATPIIMGAGCVSCHNSHPDSPKKDWKVGDVRGLEEFTIVQPIGANIFAFKYLIGYFILVTVIGLGFIALQRHQSEVIAHINRKLGETNEFLATVAQKISKYLSREHYRSIFSGQKDVRIATERKKLTIFFSDVVGFTSTTERMQPEELTRLLNEYLTEMSRIAMAHGGSVNKFIGDAILVFFGDQESRGEAEDARACVKMAFDMKHRLAELNVQWRRRGVEEPFRARMGINTGFVNVGNFGSDERMDYTIIGAEANLAARLQSIAEPGEIVLSYETYALVRDMVDAHSLNPITLKGIRRPILPYAVDGPRGSSGEDLQVIYEHGTGFDVYIDMRTVDKGTADRIARLVRKATKDLSKRKPGDTSGRETESKPASV
jgi:adenylate cyclase